MGGMFGGPKAPKPVAPKVTPMVDETALEEARKRTRTKQQTRGGRQSTMLSAGDTLGG